MSSVAPLRVVDLTAPVAPPARVAPPVAVVRRDMGPVAFRAAATRAPVPSLEPPALTLPAVLRNVEGLRSRLDEMLAQARRGRTFSPQELLCLQADAHRFAQTVELAGRAVEHGVQGLRQALNAQV